MGPAEQYRGLRSSSARGLTDPRPKIVCLDADDSLYPDALARCVSFLDKHIAAGVAYGELTLINEERSGIAS